MNIKKNFTYNLLLSITQLMLPILTFPYVTRILEAGGIGIVNYVESLTKYFLIIAVAGIPIHGMRQIAGLKEDKKALNKSFNEIFSIQLYLTLFSVFLYSISLFFFKDFLNLKTIYLMGIVLITSNIFSIEWVFQGLENFKYITIRTILLRILSVILLFTLVETKEDVNWYFFLLLFYSVANGLTNFIYINKLLKVKLVFNFQELKTHFKPILNTAGYLISISIYTLTPILILGHLEESELKKSVGFYGTATKVCSLGLIVFSAISVVLVPRLSNLAKNGDKDNFKLIIEKSLLFVFTFGVPISISLFLLAPEIITAYAGKGYKESIFCLRVMSPIIITSSLAQIFATQILIPFSKDKQNIIAVTIGAFISVILNFVLISYFMERGASITALVTEIIVTLITFHFAKEYLNIKISFRKIIETLAFIIPFILIALLSKGITNNSIYILIIYASFSFIYFVFAQLMMKNPIIISLWRNIIPLKFNKIKNK